MNSGITMEELREMDAEGLDSILVIYISGIGRVDEKFIESLKGLGLEGVYLLDTAQTYLIVPGSQYRKVEEVLEILDREKYGDGLESMPPREPFRIIRELNLS